MDITIEADLSGWNFVTQADEFVANYDERPHGSESELKTSVKPEGSQTFSGVTEPYDKGGYGNSSQGLHDTRDQMFSSGAKKSGGTSGSTAEKGMGGVKDWISSKLHGDDDTERKHEARVISDEHDLYGDSHKAETEGGDTLMNDKGEPTTDSGAAVRLASDGRTRPVVISPLCPGNHAQYSHGIDYVES